MKQRSGLKTKIFLKRKLVAALLAAALLFAGCTPASPGGVFYVQFTMRRQDVRIDGRQLSAYDFDALAGKMHARVTALEEAFSTDIEGSDLFALNHAAAGEAVDVSVDTLEAFSLSSAYAALTQGGFSPALFPLTELWGFSPAHAGHYNDPRPSPSEQEIEAALAVSDLSLFTADAAAGTLTKAESGAMLDFGGIAKGYMCDAALEILREAYAGRQIDAIFSVMSNHVLLGQKQTADGARRGYTVAIENPRYSQDMPEAANALYLTDISDCAVTTSGDNIRFYVYEGRLYPHIIDAHTGEPADNGIIGITIVMPLSVPHAGALSDALSTAGFCMPLTQALAFYEQMSEQFGATAVVITADYNYYAVGSANVLGRKEYARYSNEVLGTDVDIAAVEEVFSPAAAAEAADEVTPCAEELAYRERMEAKYK